MPVVMPMRPMHTNSIPAMAQKCQFKPVDSVNAAVLFGVEVGQQVKSLSQNIDSVAAKADPVAILQAGPPVPPQTQSTQMQTAL